MDFTFLHAADLHLDSPMRGLSRYEGAPLEELREATRGALRKLVSCAIEERVDFLLVAGDLYDGEWKDFNTGLFLTRCFQQLEKANIPVYAIKGNHDAESRLTSSLTLPSNVTMFDHRKPGTALLEELRVAIHGQSFANMRVEENLASGYPAPVPGYFNIGLLHTSADGRSGHANYAPCSVESLTLLGYDYWALGHVHQREVLCRDPWIVFPGNLQGRHVRETGDKGASLVRVSDHQVVSVEHRTLDVVRWAHLVVKVDGCDHTSELLARVEEEIRTIEQSVDERLLAVRVELVGACKVHHLIHRDLEQWRNEIRAVAGANVWVEKIKFATSSPSTTVSLQERDDAFALLMKGIGQLENDPSELEEIAKTLFTEFEQKLPAEIRRSQNGLSPTDPELIKQLLPRVSDLLDAQLRQVGDDFR